MFAFKPVDVRRFCGHYSDIGCGIFEHEGELCGRATLFISISVRKMQDGNYKCGYYCSTDGSEIDGYIYLNRDKAAFVKNLVDRLMSGDYTEDGVLLIRNLYTLDWERFDELFPNYTWEQIVEKLMPASTLDDSELISKRNLYYYVMYAALVAPERFEAGFGELLNYQRDNDLDGRRRGAIFDSVIESFGNSRDKERISAIMERAKK